MLPTSVVASIRSTSHASSRASTVSSESTSRSADNTAGVESQTNQETTRSPPEETCVLEGCRIINLQVLPTFITKISSHSSTCHGELSLVGETYRSGLASVLSAKCSGCRMEVAFPTSSKMTGVGGGWRWEANFAAVWAQMATGGGYAPLREQMSTIGVPVMKKRSFVQTEKVVCMQSVENRNGKMYVRSSSRGKENSNRTRKVA